MPPVGSWVSTAPFHHLCCTLMPRTSQAGWMVGGLWEPCWWIHFQLRRLNTLRGSSRTRQWTRAPCVSVSPCHLGSKTVQSPSPALRGQRLGRCRFSPRILPKSGQLCTYRGLLVGSLHQDGDLHRPGWVKIQPCRRPQLLGVQFHAISPNSNFLYNTTFDWFVTRWRFNLQRQSQHLCELQTYKGRAKPTTMHWEFGHPPPDNKGETLSIRYGQVRSHLRPLDALCMRATLFFNDKGKRCVSSFLWRFLEQARTMGYPLVVRSVRSTKRMSNGGRLRCHLAQELVRVRQASFSPTLPPQKRNSGILPLITKVRPSALDMAKFAHTWDHWMLCVWGQRFFSNDKGKKMCEQLPLALFGASENHGISTRVLGVVLQLFKSR